MQGSRGLRRSGAALLRLFLCGAGGLVSCRSGFLGRGWRVLKAVGAQGRQQGWWGGLQGEAAAETAIVIDGPRWSSTAGDDRSRFRATWDSHVLPGTRISIIKVTFISILT